MNQFHTIEDKDFFEDSNYSLEFPEIESLADEDKLQRLISAFYTITEKELKQIERPIV